MSRTSFGQEMQEVKNEILLLATMVEEAVMESAQALKDNDLDRSRQVLPNDLRINSPPRVICAGWPPIWKFARNWSEWESMQRGLPISISTLAA